MPLGTQISFHLHGKLYSPLLIWRGGRERGTQRETERKGEYAREKLVDSVSVSKMVEKE